jgi:hypothetical protein
VTHFGDTRFRGAGDHGEEREMSEYFLADLKAEERVRQRELDQEKGKAPAKSQDMKITLLGDFLFPTNETQGCDPYNSQQGKTPIEAWRHRRPRR